MNSIWSSVSEHPRQHPPLRGSVQADVVVIGAGITGLSTALALAARGREVVVLEAGRVGRGNSGRATGNLYGVVSSGLAGLRRTWDDDTLRGVVAARMAAIAQIEQTVDQYGIDCDFARRPMLLAVESDEREAAELDSEAEACRVAGLPVQLGRDADGLPFPVRRHLRIGEQAQFDPLRYCQGLAAALLDVGVQLFEGSVVREIDARRGHVVTEDGDVHAGEIVFATHTPKGFNLVQAEMEPYREYGVALRRAASDGPEGILWIRDRMRSVRRFRHGDREWLLAIGERHKVGHGEADADYHGRLADYLRARFEVGAVDVEWSAQQYRPADGLPYIGRSGHDNVWIATGFAADGLVWGTVAAELIAAGSVGQTHPLAERLSPRRFTPIKSAGVWAAEGRMVLSHLVRSRLSAAELHSLAEVPAGAGRIVELDGDKHAVYRADDGALLVLSPVCPHLKCHVAWNGAEATWDCPCHGSRFAADGRVIEGPALAPLERHEWIENDLLHTGRRPLPAGAQPALGRR